MTESEYALLETRAYELYLENFEQEWLRRREAWLNSERSPGFRGADRGSERGRYSARL